MFNFNVAGELMSSGKPGSQEDPENIDREPAENRDVHTEHCCAEHGCKYGEEDICPVWLGYKKQSYGYWDGNETHSIPKISAAEFAKRNLGSDENLNYA